MKTNQETKKAMYEALAEKGIAKNQVSISIRGSMYDDIIRATIQDIHLNIETVENVLKRFESVRWDERAQEILQGCNIFVEVKYNNDKIVEWQRENGIEEKALEIYRRAKKITTNGTYIIENDHRFIYFPNDDYILILTSSGRKTLRGCGHYQIMTVLTNYLLEKYEDLETYSTYEIEEEKRWKAQVEEQAKKRQEWEEEEKKRQTTRQKSIQSINENTIIKEIQEEERQTKTFEWAHLNKNATLKEYKEEVEEGAFYNRKAKITHEWLFTKFEDLEYLQNHLLTDYNQISGLGGTFSDDPKLDGYTDINQVPREIIEKIEFVNLVVAVVYEGKIQFVIDPQGFNYPRYVGLPSVC